MMNLKCKMINVKNLNLTVIQNTIFTVSQRQSNKNEMMILLALTTI